MPCAKHDATCFRTSCGYRKTPVLKWPAVHENTAEERMGFWWRLALAGFARRWNEWTGQILGFIPRTGNATLTSQFLLTWSFYKCKE